jgi:hypothetical protein
MIYLPLSNLIIKLYYKRILTPKCNAGCSEGTVRSSVSAFGEFENEQNLQNISIANILIHMY